MFRRKKWKYLILDEAHMINNWKSQRWQTLLNFQTGRRLLLTGTRPLPTRRLSSYAHPCTGVVRSDDGGFTTKTKVKVANQSGPTYSGGFAVDSYLV